MLHHMHQKWLSVSRDNSINATQPEKPHGRPETKGRNKAEQNRPVSWDKKKETGRKDGRKED